MPLVDSAVQGVPLTADDLDQMVKNFQPTSKADHIPVRFGPAKGNGPIVAKISALKNDGSVLSGKLADVDPGFNELMQAGVLGRRTSRSLSFERDADKGASLAEMGFKPPRIYHAGSWHDGPSSSAALDDLVGAHREGEAIQFCAGDAGLVEVVLSLQPRRAAKSGGANKRNSERLNDLAKARQQEKGISFCEALEAVARENPKLTLPDYLSGNVQQSASNVLANEGWRYQTNSEDLAERANALAYEKNISYEEALSRVVEENPRLTLPDGVFSFDEGTRPKTNSEKLADLAKARAREHRLSYCDALTDVARKHPELTRG